MELNEWILITIVIMLWSQYLISYPLSICYIEIHWVGTRMECLSKKLQRP